MATKKRSGGPRTARGKRVSASNALRHGLTSAKPRLLEWESASEFRGLMEAMVVELAPEGVVEALLVDRVVWCAWRLRRAARVEQVLLTGSSFEQRDGAIVRVKWIDPGEVDPDEPADGEARDPRAVAAEREAREGSALQTFGRGAGELTRYETTLERSMYRALWELRATQEARREREGQASRKPPGFGTG